MLIMDMGVSMAFGWGLSFMVEEHSFEFLAQLGLYPVIVPRRLSKVVRVVLRIVFMLMSVLPVVMLVMVMLVVAMCQILSMVLMLIMLMRQISLTD